MADPEALAQLALRVATRRTHMGLTVDEAARRAGISPVTWGRVEKAQTSRDLTYAAIERVLSWEHGAIKVILAESDTPRTAEASPAEVPPPPTDTMVAAIWASDLPESDKLELISILMAERQAADQRVMDRVAERLKWRRRNAS